MPSSFCEFWWEIEDRYGRYRSFQSGVNHFDIPPANERSILRDLREACEQLQAPGLFGPDDSELLRRGPDGPAKLLTDNANLTRRLRVVGIRVPLIQDGCLQYAVARREIVAHWESSPPRLPVNSVNSLLSYVLDSWNRGFDHHQAGGGNFEELLETLSVTLRNFRVTADWFHQSGLPKNSIPAIQPRSFAQLQRYVLRIISWLENLSSATRTEAEDSSDQPGYLDLVVNEVHRTVTRRGDRFAHLQPISFDGEVIWPLFQALYAKGGAALSQQEINELPGERGAARRAVKGRLNAQLRPIEVVIPNRTWQLLDAR